MPEMTHLPAPAPRHVRSPLVAIVALAGLSLAACTATPGAASPSSPVSPSPIASASSGAAASPSPSEPGASPEPSRSIGQVSLPPSSASAVPADLLDRIVADAAIQTGSQPADIRVVSAEAKNWPDSSLGCPTPGHAYSQIITPGYRIVIGTADGRTLDYRATARGAFSICPSVTG